MVSYDECKAESPNNECILVSDPIFSVDKFGSIDESLCTMPSLKDDAISGQIYILYSPAIAQHQRLLKQSKILRKISNQNFYNNVRLSVL